MPSPKPSADMERWRAVALERASGAPSYSVPFRVLLGEAVDLSRFCQKYFEPQSSGGVALPGLASVAGKGAAKLLGADTGEELFSLQKAAADADAIYRFVTDAPAASPYDRGLALLSELRATLEFYADDGVADEDDARLATLRELHESEPSTMDALAYALEQYAALAALHRDALDGLGGFRAATIDEAKRIATDLRARPQVPTRQSPEADAAQDLRDRYIALLLERMNVVRSAARFVYRDHPAVVREVTSSYERRRRAESRRAAAKAGPVDA